MQATHESLINPLHQQSRFNMIEQQIRPCNVLNQTVLNTLYQVHREKFVPKASRAFAFADTRLTLTEHAKMLTPILEGRILQVLDIQKTDRILIVGTGSGYLAACAGHLGASVTSLDLDDYLTRMANALLIQQNIQNVNCQTIAFDAFLNENSHEKYDVVILTGSLKTLPPHFKACLNEGGRLFAAIGDLPVLHACVFHHLSGVLQVDDLFETTLERLIGYEDNAVFEF